MTARMFVDGAGCRGHARDLTRSALDRRGGSSRAARAATQRAIDGEPGVVDGAVGLRPRDGDGARRRCDRRNARRRPRADFTPGKRSALKHDEVAELTYFEGGGLAEGLMPVQTNKRVLAVPGSRAVSLDEGPYTMPRQTLAPAIAYGTYGGQVGAGATNADLREAGECIERPERSSGSAVTGSVAMTRRCLAVTVVAARRARSSRWRWALRLAMDDADLTSSRRSRRAS